MAEQEPTYKTIANPAEGLYKEKGSKFLAFALPVADEEEVKSHISELQKAHHGARHYCYAYRINPKDIYERANDDGEPRHSAGTPILGQLQSFSVVNVLVVVVRYFGGTKLGVSGLVNAYRTAAREALEAAEIIEVDFTASFVIEFEYPEMNDVMRLIKQYDAIIKHQNMGMSVKMELEIREDKLLLIQSQLTLLKSLKFRPL